MVDSEDSAWKRSKEDFLELDLDEKIVLSLMSVVLLVVGVIALAVIVVKQKLEKVNRYLRD